MSLRGHKIIPLACFDFVFNSHTFTSHESMNMLVSAKRWRQFVLQKSVCVCGFCVLLPKLNYEATRLQKSRHHQPFAQQHSVTQCSRWLFVWCIEDANALVVSSSERLHKVFSEYKLMVAWFIFYKQMISKMYEEMVARSMIVRSLCGVLLVTNSCDLSQAIKRRKWGSVSRDASPSMTPSCYSLCDLLKFFDSGWNVPSTCPKVQTAPCDIWKHFPVCCIMCAQ